MPECLRDFSALINAFGPLIYTEAGIVIALSIIAAMVSPFVELVRFERRWYDD